MVRTYYQSVILTVTLFISHTHWAMENGFYASFNSGIGITQENPQKVDGIFEDFKKNHIPDRELINNLLNCFSSAEKLQHSNKIANIGLGWQLSPNVSIESYPVIYQKPHRLRTYPEWNCGVAIGAKLIMPLPFFESIRVYEKIGKLLVVQTTRSLKKFNVEGTREKYFSFSKVYDQFVQNENAYWFLATGLRIKVSSTKTLDISWERHPYFQNKVAHFLKIGLDWHL